MEYISRAKKEEIKGNIRDYLIPSIIQGLEKTGLVQQVKTKLAHNIHQKPIEIRVGYQITKSQQSTRNRARLRCTQLRAAIDEVVLRNYTDQGIQIEYPATNDEKNRKRVIAKVIGIENIDYIQLQKLFVDINKKIWNFIDPSGRTAYHPPEEEKVYTGERKKRPKKAR